MIIDNHGHYSTEPLPLHSLRDQPLAGLAGPARMPPS